METRTVYLWPTSKSLTVRGGDNLEVNDNENWRPATVTEKQLVQVAEIAQRLADNDILCCDSSLVDDMVNAAASEELPREMAKEWDLTENAVNLIADPSDWGVEQCREWLTFRGFDLPDPNPWAMNRDELVELLTSISIDCQDDEPSETLREAAVSNIDDKTLDGLRDWREAVRDNADREEVFEWWRVTKWLADKLEAEGEVVLRNSYAEWWGRTCTGQSMLLDGTLQKVAASL